MQIGFAAKWVYPNLLQNFPFHNGLNFGSMAKKLQASNWLHLRGEIIDGLYFFPDFQNFLHYCIIYMYQIIYKISWVLKGDGKEPSTETDQLAKWAKKRNKILFRDQVKKKI